MREQDAATHEYLLWRCANVERFQGQFAPQYYWRNDGDRAAWRHDSRAADVFTPSIALAWSEYYEHRTYRWIRIIHYANGRFSSVGRQGTRANPTRRPVRG